MQAHWFFVTVFTGTLKWKDVVEKAKTLSCSAIEEEEVVVVVVVVVEVEIVVVVVVVVIVVVVVLVVVVVVVVVVVHRYCVRWRRYWMDIINS